MIFRTLTLNEDRREISKGAALASVFLAKRSLLHLHMVNGDKLPSSGYCAMHVSRAT